MDQNELDKLFADKLRDYTKKPGPQVWEKLEERLEKKNSKVLPMWWKYGAAASIALLIGAGIWIASNQTNSDLGKVVATTNNNKIQKQSVSQGESQKSIDITAVPESRSVVADKSDLKQSNTTFTIANIGEKSLKRTNAEKSDLERTGLKTEQTKEESIAKVQPENKGIEMSSNIPEIKTGNTLTPKVESNPVLARQETIIINLVDTQEENNSLTTAVAESPKTKKASRFSRIWKQLKNVKNGDEVNWDEVGVNPGRILAKADESIEKLSRPHQSDSEKNKE